MVLTQSRLKELLYYDPYSGIFTWKISSGNMPAGSAAGCLSPEGYIRITIAGKKYKAHRLAWFYVYGYFPENQVVHLNGARDDNRISNLREVS